MKDEKEEEKTALFFLHPSSLNLTTLEGWQSGRSRRVANADSVERRNEGSNPSPSAADVLWQVASLFDAAMAQW
jgi:hypothetical protein